MVNVHNVCHTHCCGLATTTEGPRDGNSCWICVDALAYGGISSWRKVNILLPFPMGVIFNGDGNIEIVYLLFSKRNSQFWHCAWLSMSPLRIHSQIKLEWLNDLKYESSNIRNFSRRNEENSCLEKSSDICSTLKYVVGTVSGRCGWHMPPPLCALNPALHKSLWSKLSSLTMNPSINDAPAGIAVDVSNCHDR